MLAVLKQMHEGSNGSARQQEWVGASETIKILDNTRRPRQGHTRELYRMHTL